MDGNYYTALAGLAGVAIGGLTSFGTTWVTQRTQADAREREISRTRRERLYTAFIEEAARLFGDALSHERDEVTDLIKLYAILARMRLTASASVIEAGEGVVMHVIRRYQEPNRSLHELRIFARDGGMDPLLPFSEACRIELAQR